MFAAEDMTDLVTVPSPYRSVLSDGPHTHMNSVHEHDAGERVLVDAFNNMIGKINALNSQNQFRSTSRTAPKIQNQVQALARCVGRVFIQYESADKLTTDVFAGTGFLISPNLVLTAQHVVKPQHMKTGKVLTVKQVIFTLASDATFGDEITFQYGNFVTLEILPKFVDNIEEFKRFIRLDNGSAHASPSADTWMIMNDFAVLRSKKKFKHFLFPDVSNVIANPVVLGYPGFIDEAKFCEDYLNKQQSSELYEEVKSLCLGFQRKVLSSHGTVSELNMILTHTCPTLRGTSGGPLAGFKETPSFHAVHIGGSVPLNNNFAISIRQLELCLEIMHHLFTYDRDVLITGYTEVYKLHAAKVSQYLPAVAKFFMPLPNTVAEGDNPTVHAISKL